MKYVNKRNGKVATQGQFNEKTKTYIMDYEDGTNTTVTTSTLKRWWKEVKDEEEVVEPLIDLDNPVTDEEAQELGMVGGDEAVELEVVDPDVAGDGTPLAEVGKQIAEQAKKKAEKAKAERQDKEKKKAMKTEKISVQELIEKVRPVVEGNGYRFKLYENAPRILPLYQDIDNGKARFTIYLAQKKCVLNLKESQVPEGYNPDKVRNCPLAAAFDFNYNELDKLNIMLKAIKKEEN